MNRVTRLMTTCMLITFTSQAFAAAPATLLLDEFNATAGTQASNQTWAMPADDDGSFFGRTKLKVDPAQTPTQDGSGFAVLQLDTFYVDDPNAGLFHAPEIRSKERFGGGGGISYKWTGAYDLASSTIDPTDGGTVLGGFTFGLQKFDADNNVTRDEIDWELLLNEQRFVDSGNQRPLTNAYDNANFVGDPGNAQFLAPGTDMSVQHDYEIRQLRDRIEWYQDDALVRTETGAVPRDPSEFRLNVNVPDAGFPEAYDANLTSATTAEANQQLFAKIDRVEIKELGAAFDPNISTTRRTALNLADHSFSELTAPTPAFTGGWTAFNNFFPAGIPSLDGNKGNGGPDFSFDGDDSAAKVFGAYNGTDGVMRQRVEEAPGQTFDGNVLEAKINVYTESADSIKDTTNILLTLMRFYDAANNLIQDPNDPDNGALNAVEVINLDGRLDIAEDTWITLNVRAKVPDGTQYVEVFPLFVQTQCNAEGGFDCPGGSAWVDDIELNLLTDILDTNLDGIVDAADNDFIVANFGGDPNLAANVNLDGVIDANDVADWLLEFGDTGTVAGDYNDSGQVEQGDLDLVLLNWGQDWPPEVSGWINGQPTDGKIDQNDLDGVLLNWGNTSAVAAAGVVREPSSLLLLVLACLGCCRKGAVTLRRAC